MVDKLENELREFYGNGWYELFTMNRGDNQMNKDDAQSAMPRYQSHKKVWALKIKTVTANSTDKRLLVAFEESGYAPMDLAYDIVARYTPVPGDYYMVYDDGYKSISPAKAFEEGYTRL